MKKMKLALLGCGYLNHIVANAVKNDILSEYELVGVMGRNPERTRAFANYYNCTPCTNIDEFMALEPDFVAEAASPKAIIDYTEIILKGGSNIVVLSTGAFANLNLFEKVKQIAIENNRKIYIAGGAVGGFDLLRTASLMSPIDATMTSKKSPAHLYYTPYYREGLMNITEPERVFAGTVKEIMDQFPYIFNVVMATALASAGPEDTRFNIDAVPNFRGDDYKIQVVGEQIALDLNIYSSNYSIAGWSVVAVLQNAVSPIVF